MNTHNLSLDLAHFTGSETYYRYALRRNFTYTEGVEYLAANAGCYWLIDEIILNHPKLSLHQDFQVWTLTVNEDASAVLTCTDGNDNILTSRDIPFTDFPLPSITLWFANNVLYLPSEH